MDLWCHVIDCPKVSIEVSLSMSSFNRCSKPKVCNFQIIIIIEQQILWLQITMCESFVVAMIKSVHQLLEVVSRGGLIKLP